MGLFSKMLPKKDMVNPMDGLLELQKAMDNGFKLTSCTIYTELLVIVDNPENKLRFTYVNVIDKKIIAYCVYVVTDPIDSVLCLNIGYAVPNKCQSQGLGAEIIQKSIGELKHTIKGQGINEFYIEALTGIDNIVSQKLAKKYVSTKFDKVTDSYSRQPAYHYKCLFKL